MHAHNEAISFKLLKILSDKRLHTYIQLCSDLGCTTLTLFKYIKRLTELGVTISQVRGLGFIWPRPFILLNKVSLLESLRELQHEFSVYTFDLLESTSTYLALNKLSYLQEKRIPVILCELQTKGRGTSNRHWYSNLGGSLTFSLLWRFTRRIQHIQTLSLVLGISLVRVIRKISHTDIYLKWPNDIIFEKKKLAGILTECRSVDKELLVSIIGIGINFKLPPNAVILSNYGVTDLFEITGQTLDRNQILAQLLIELREILIAYEQFGFVYFRREWESYHFFQGQPITLKSVDASTISGVVSGISVDGSLILNTDSGHKAFSMGEISIQLSD
ncbi:biotin--[acetyl-CoA-carboxylase] ligase [Nitrosomonas marina]|uniref:biotin--[biotin carboxyl-carrier protein] ligase n=1 Tax=Nitrosomonas marina TaxID=917 RepID=A0A1H8ERJ5_9PROT|nr:biotin--[acetyl-CoA-carboxylase] ligase [Nitrosomonas marina]SEN22113.1 BirA family transcriptional regulator, biotin operon repressor / biotin-[acetyl-CoA-carboxylase] ligase [Nitrosomonas marina]